MAQKSSVTSNGAWWRDVLVTTLYYYYNLGWLGRGDIFDRAIPPPKLFASFVCSGALGGAFETCVVGVVSWQPVVVI